MASARPIGDIIKPIVLRAIGLGRLQEFLDSFQVPENRREWIDAFLEGDVVTADEARLLFEHNKREGV